jgi:hypothetical protein
MPFQANPYHHTIAYLIQTAVVRHAIVSYAGDQG